MGGTLTHLLDVYLSISNSTRHLNHHFCFDKSKRLLSPYQYKYVFDESKIKASTKNFLLLAAAGQSDKPRVGVIIAKKHVRLAVNRNKFKRIIRENFRLSAILHNLDIVILLRCKQVNYENSHIQEDLMLLWRRFEKSVQNK